MIFPGKFVSESKFVENPAAFIPHIRSRNKEALAGLITKPEVERRLLQRLRKKASTYAQDYAPDGEPIPLASSANGNGSANGHGGALGKLDVEGVVELYENYIIPLTKDVEVSDEIRVETRVDETYRRSSFHQVDYLLQRLDGLSEDEVEALLNQPPP